MRKVNVTVIYTEYPCKNVNPKYYTLENLTVRTCNSHYITLYNVDWDYTDKLHKYEYEDFQDLYKTVLNFLKQNDFYATYFTAFGTKHYDIAWIERRSNEVQLYGYKDN